MSTIYAITIDTVPAYVGETDQVLVKRLDQHLHESKTGDTKKCRVLRAAVEAGCQIGIETLEENAADDAEYRWKQILEFSGHVLINSKEGNRGAPINEAGLKRDIKAWKVNRKRRKTIRTPSLDPVAQQSVEAEYARLRQIEIDAGRWKAVR